MEPPICQDNLGRSYIPFQLPISLITCGSAFSGKSTFIAKLIDNKSKMFSPEPVEIIYVYSTWQPIYHSLEKANTNIKSQNYHCPPCGFEAALSRKSSGEPSTRFPLGDT